MKNILCKTAFSFFIWQLAFGTFFLLLPINTVNAQEQKKPIEYAQEKKGENKQNPAPSNTPTQPTDYNCKSTSDDYVDNGISITEIKPYDERTLLAQLREYEASLARIVYPDNSGLYQNLNRLQGNITSASSVSLTASTIPLPSFETTQGSKSSNGVKETNSTSQEISSGIKDDKVNDFQLDKTGTIIENTSGGETNYSQVIKQGAIAPIIPTSVASAGNLPSTLSYDFSSQDILEKQTALTYQILNLRALLNQSYSDRLISTDGENFKARPQAFIGFTVNIEPKFPGAVAEVEITINPRRGNDKSPKLSVISLFPEEKTYNVAKITDDKKSVGVGGVVSVLNIGASASKSNSTMYLVRDTDTVAFQKPALKYVKNETDVNGKVTETEVKRFSEDWDEEVPDDDAVSFVWQFRPVLGQKTVNPGIKRVFALIAVPQALSDSTNWRGEFTVGTKWRDLKSNGVVRHKLGKYKRLKANLRGNSEDTFYSECYGNILIPTLKNVEKALAPKVTGAKWQDNGNGQVSVFIDGENFSPGTQVMFGNTLVDRPSNGLIIQSDSRLILTGPAQIIAKFDPMIIGRYGDTKLDNIETESSNPSGSSSGTTATKVENPYNHLKIDNIDFKPKDAQNSTVVLKLTKKSDSSSTEVDYDIFNHPSFTSPVIEIGNSIFGLTNTPFLVKKFNSSDKTIDLHFLAPNDLLKNSDQIIVRELVNRKSRVTYEYNDGFKAKLTTFFSVKAVQKLSEGKADPVKPETPQQMQIAITGTGFDQQFQVVAGGKTYNSSAPKDFDIKDSSKLRVLTIPKTVGNIVILQGENDPVRIDLSQPNPFPTAKINSQNNELKVDKGNSGNVALYGSNLDSIKSIFYEDMDLSFAIDKSKSFFNLYIPSALTNTAGKKEITLVMRDDQRVPFTIVVQ